MEELKITFETIANANKTITTTDIKGKEYAEVNQRIKAFRMVYPTGTIETELLGLAEGICTFRAKIFDENGKLLGTGTANEKESSSFINKTSFIENCETSAVGRALGMCGFGIDTSVASYEEVATAIENQKPANVEKKELKQENISEFKKEREELEKQCAELNIDLESPRIKTWLADKLQEKTGKSKVIDDFNLGQYNMLLKKLIDGSKKEEE